MPKTRKKLGEHLLEWGAIDEQQLEQALSVAKGQGKRIGETLVELEYVDEEQVAKALAEQFNLEYVDLDTKDAVRASNLELMPTELIQKFLVLPLEQQNGRLKVVIHDPLDLDLYDVLRFRMNCEIDTAIAPRAKIKGFVDRMLYSTHASIDEQAASIDVEVQEASNEPSQEELDAVRTSEEDQDAPVVRLVHRVITEAVNSRASDIHIEPMADRVRLRYRIDGVCHERDNFPKHTQAPMITRLKILSGMKIDERRLPQDGRIKMRIGGEQVDFRVSSIPSYHGESMVLRILRPESVKIGLENLGFERDTLETFNRIIKRPNGIFLVTGPTGSGKTTTLYSALDALNQPDRKIITAEDPVEYNFTGVNQAQVREDIGLSFAKILRSMLRQAPNIILVGEIRDVETAEIAIQAALTGHLVFSTLHTNDAPAAITRLCDMGVKPFLVASSIQAVMAQRLIRTLCPECREPDPEPSSFHLKLCGITKEELAQGSVHRPVGCEKCQNTGFKGRQGIYEFMQMNSELRELAFHRASTARLRQAAIATGMRELSDDGKLKVLRGVTTPEEVARVAQVEGLVEEEEEEEEDLGASV